MSQLCCIYLQVGTEWLRFLGNRCETKFNLLDSFSCSSFLFFLSLSGSWYMYLRWHFRMKSSIAKFWISLCQPLAASVTRHIDWQMKFFILETFQDEVTVCHFPFKRNVYSLIPRKPILWCSPTQERVPDNDERWQTTKSSCEQLETTFGEVNPERVHCDRRRERCEVRPAHASDS